MAKRIDFGGGPVNEGEATAIYFLEKNLPDNYIIYPNIEIPQSNGPALELDAVIIAPHAVYAVEVKDWHGTIIGNDAIWLLGRSERPNPVKSINYKARVLKGRITMQGTAHKDVWVEGMVIIVDSRTVLNLSGDCKQKTYYLQNAVDFITKPNRLHAPNPVAPNALQNSGQAVKEAVAGVDVKARSSKKLTFNQYEVIETLDAKADLQEYLAQNTLIPQANQVRLRVFENSPYLPAVERERRKNQITNEFRLLQNVGYSPNVVRVNDLFEYNGDKIVEVTEWSNEGTLAALLLKQEPMTVARKLEIMQGLLRGLQEVHAQGILHRAINPYNILISANYTPRLMNFDRAKLDSSDTRASQTVWQQPQEAQVLPYIPPELIGTNYKAYPSSDLYSLGVVFYELLAGIVPFNNPREALQSSYVPVSDFSSSLPHGTDEFIQKLIQTEPEARFQVAADALQTLTEIINPTKPDAIQEATEQKKAEADRTTPKKKYEIGDTIDGQYRILDFLGRGGSSNVYKVYNSLHDTTYAMKIINMDVELERLQKEFKLLRALQHPYIARAEWAAQIYQSQYYLVSELVEGETLNSYTSGKQPISLSECVTLMQQLLEALEYMHSASQGHEPMLHRDIKPSNIIRTISGLKVIDFNIAEVSGKAGNTFTGTVGYVAPDVLQDGWDGSTDLFAAGVVFYELITHHHPYESNNSINFNNAPHDPREFVPELSDAFAAFLVKAVRPRRADRFTDAATMRQALAAISPYTKPIAVQPNSEEYTRLIKLLDITQEEQSIPNYNPFVTRLLTLYSQARRNNRGTRGLDGIAKVTYIPTKLDEKLKDDILLGKHRLVIITGNAGDGKTAFIQQIEGQVSEDGANVQRFSHGNGSSFRYNGYNFATNYDGSQDEGENVNDTVLREFFKIFAGDVSPLAEGPVKQQVRIIAINEGRLRDFLESNHAEFGWLRRQILDFFDESIELDTGLLLVNLNWRSVVAGGANSIFSRQLKELTKDIFWDPCQSCQLRNDCFIKFNADTFRDPNYGPQVIERWRTIFETVHLRRRLHITMRDLRSALSYILFRDHSCTDVAESLNVNSNSEYLNNFYYNALQGEDALTLQKANNANDSLELEVSPSPTVSTDRLIRLLTQVDLALVSNPQLDRAINYGGEDNEVAIFSFGERSVADVARLNQEKQNLVFGYELSKDKKLINQHRRLHQTWRRKYFFEQRDTDAQTWLKMLPYEHFEEFRHFIGQYSVSSNPKSQMRKELKDEIIAGISALEGSRRRNKEYIWLRASQTDKPSIKSFRLFPASEFDLGVRSIGKLGEYLEYLPDHLVLRHIDEKAELIISLDLLELLFSVGHGFRPSLNDLRGPYVNLLIFRNALSHLPFRELLLTQNDQDFYKLAANNANVISLAKEEEI